MEKETLEYICDQLSAMESAFDDLEDACYHLRLTLEKELKEKK